MPRYKVFCVTRDEYDLIEDFIVFYAHLFGFENVHIIDNNSRHPHVLHVYQKYIPRGLHVVYESNYRNRGQGEAFTKHMRLWKDACDFLIGLDTDEFLFVDRPSCQLASQPASKPVTRSDIDAVFEAIPPQVTRLRVGSYLWSILDPDHPSYSGQKIPYAARHVVFFENRLPMTMQKYFYRSHAFLSTGNGNHDGHTTNNQTQTIPIGLHHYNECGQYRSFERARTIVNGYGYMNIDAPLKEQVCILQRSLHQIPFGSHRVRQYLWFLLRAFLVDFFIQYCKRLPSNKELEQYVNLQKERVPLESIEEEFRTCEEARQKESHPIPTTIPEDQKRSLIYYDPPLSEYTIPYIERTTIRETLRLAPYAIL